MAQKLLLPPRRPRLPLPLQRRSTDEYATQPHHPRNLPLIEQLRAEGPKYAAKLSMSTGDYWGSRQGTAAALRALNEAWGSSFYDAPPEAALDREAADASLGGDQFIMDVHTHYTPDRLPLADVLPYAFFGFADTVTGDLFKGLDKLVRNQAPLLYGFSEYLRCVYGESETDVAVLTSAPIAQGTTKTNLLDNPEMLGTRELIERLGGTGRLINDCVITPNMPGEIEMMDRWAEECRPGAWKIYTQFGREAEGFLHWDTPAFMLDDNEVGQPFLRQARKTGVRLICVHKGLTFGPDQGWDGPSSPKDIGPAAKAFPDINFILYHSGYELRQGDQSEGPYSEEVSHIGTNRLIKSLKDAGIDHNSNVYADLGTTWYCLAGHPDEAAHVMGKFLSVLGEDNITWGTDSIWYGSPQPLIDAFRAFQIPEEYRERYGYPELTPQAKEKILGLNAARLYGIDPIKTRAATRNDSLAWLKAALDEYKAKGSPSAV